MENFEKAQKEREDKIEHENINIGGMFNSLQLNEFFYWKNKQKPFPPPNYIHNESKRPTFTMKIKGKESEEHENE